MTQSIWSANNGAGGQGLFDLFSNLDAARADGTEGLGLAELGPQPADITAADQNFFSALNEALAGLSSTQTAASPQNPGDFALTNNQTDKPSGDDANQLALALLAGGAGAAYMPPSLPQTLRNFEKPNASSEVLYSAPLANQKPMTFQQLQQLQQNGPMNDTTVNDAAQPITSANLAVLQASRSPLKLFEDGNTSQPLTADELKNLLANDARSTQVIVPEIQGKTANTNATLQSASTLQQLRSDLSRLAPHAQVEVLSVSSENKAASQPDAQAVIPLSQSLGELRHSLKDHQFIFNKHLADLENKMSSRLDEALAKQMIVDSANGPMAPSNKADLMARIMNPDDAMAAQNLKTLDGKSLNVTAQPAALLNNAEQNAANTNANASQNTQALNPALMNAQANSLSQAARRNLAVGTANKEKLDNQNQIDQQQLFEGSSYAANSAENSEFGTKNKKENGQDKNDEKRDPLVTLLDHKGPGKVWTTDAKDKLSDIGSVSPLTRGALERTRNMAIQLQGRGGTAKIQISDNHTGCVNCKL